MISESIISIRRMLRSKSEEQRKNAIDTMATMEVVPKELLSDIKNYLWQYGGVSGEVVEKMIRLYKKQDPKGYEAFVVLRNKSMGNLVTKDKKVILKPVVEDEEVKEFGETPVDLVGELDNDDEEEEEND